MTVQASEILIYRGQEYSLFGTPLYDYIKNKENLKFEEYSTSNYRGYQGYWLLKDNKLFLTKIENSNYTLLDLFNSNEPILAEWYSGQIEFGIGKSYYNALFEYNECCVTLEIENGIILNKKIIKYFSTPPQLEFGKYKGKNINELIYGKFQKNIYDTLNSYINCLIEFFRNRDYKYNVHCPVSELTNEDFEFIKLLFLGFGKTNFEYFLTQTYIATSSIKFWYDTIIEDEIANKISVLLEKILSSNFNNIQGGLTKSDLNNDNEYNEIDEKSVLINGDLKYLIWAIKNVEKFAVPPHQLQKDYSIKNLIKFSTNRLNEYIFEYTPIFENKEFSFSDDILKLNIEKFEKINNVIFDIKNQNYYVNLNKIELMNQYGYYLDENFKVEIERNNYNDINSDDHSSDWNHYNDDLDMDQQSDEFWNQF